MGARRVRQYDLSFVLKPLSALCLLPFLEAEANTSFLFVSIRMHGMPPDLLPTLRRILRPTVLYQIPHRKSFWLFLFVSQTRHWPSLPLLTILYHFQVPYVTVVQHASGLALACEANFNELFPNILVGQKLQPLSKPPSSSSLESNHFTVFLSEFEMQVLSAGGFGHVPIPLLKQTEPQNNFRPFTSPSPAAALAAVASATAQVASESRTQTSAEDLRRNRFEPGLEGDGNLEVEESEVGDSSQGSSVNLKGSKRNTPETISVIEAWAMSMAAEASSSLPAAIAAQWGVPRTHLVSYVGTPHNAPGELRAHMIQAMFSTAMKVS
jgi:hypothetical protein